MKYVITSIMTETGWASKGSLTRTTSARFLKKTGTTKQKRLGGAKCQF
jgi:hypothetical protein